MNIIDPLLVFDLETQRDFYSVGGRTFINELKMSVGVVWDSRSDKFFVYREEKVEDLITHLSSGPLVVGFNHIYFDFEVLSGYRSKEARPSFLDELRGLKNLDLLLDIKNRTGHRVSLNSLASPTLNISKSADGLMALKWYREYCTTGEEHFMQKIIDYCQQDVAVTRDLYYQGLEHGKVLHETKTGDFKWIKVDWRYSAVENQLAEKQVTSTPNQLSLF